MQEPTLGVIGGSGLYELDGLVDVERRRVPTPFGDPSDELTSAASAGRGSCSSRATAAATGSSRRSSTTAPTYSR
jgi:purine nucleoside phosphorylase